VRSGKWAYGSNRRNCLIMVRGEKEVCKYYIDLAHDAARLGALSWRAFQAALDAHHNDGGDAARYFRAVLAPLVRRACDDALHEAREGVAALGLRSPLPPPPPPTSLGGVAAAAPAAAAAGSGGGGTSSSGGGTT